MYLRHNDDNTKMNDKKKGFEIEEVSTDLNLSKCFRISSINSLFSKKNVINTLKGEIARQN